MKQPDSSPGAVSNFLVIGIGASAGGIKALQDFFSQVNINSGMAYVVILHLSPDHDTRLSEILRLATALPVIQVTQKTMIAPDHIYIVPPNRHLVMEDGHIVPTDNVSVEDRRAPVDIFFRTLGDTHGARSVCVVLSGTGANGSMGLKRAKEMGGAVFVQSPREAEYNEMPRNAISTGLVDEVLPVMEIAGKIVEYNKGLKDIRIPADLEKRPEDLQQALHDILNQLRKRTGHDFANYKRPTLLRRMERRINIRNLKDLPAYAAFLNEHPEETQALLKDLLISVTNFFRDRKAFEALEQDVILSLVQSKSADQPLRIWVAGCATGEEAYSLAMLCSENIKNKNEAPKIQIFATDIDETAIAQAREGLYTLNDAADVSPERLRSFFTKEGDSFRVRSEIREMILFASHNFIKDPPFSHLDLISCRNVLIYLNQVAQERVMSTFHFALNPNGYLFLGSSETVNGATDIYTIHNRDYHIFQSRKITHRQFPVPESVPAFRFESSRLSGAGELQERRSLERPTFGDLHQQLLEQYAPPSVIVNEEYDIVHLSDRAGIFLQHAGGEPSQNLLKLIKPELRLELRSALYQAVQQRIPIESKPLAISIGDITQSIIIHVRPVLEQGGTPKGFLLVLFAPSALEARQTTETPMVSDEPVARQLEQELIQLKNHLRASNEQYDFHAEELKASNEELQAMNEELRSAAEELETSKEELQSINEELRTVNQELKIKIEETTLSNNNLQNLINSVNLGTIFLDRGLRIVLFTPTARDIFNLIPADYGRSLSDITHRLDYASLITDAEWVLEKLQVLEREASTMDGAVYLMRVLPYRTGEGHINGVVITFLDISERKRSENNLRASEERFRAIVSQNIAGIAYTDLSGKIQFANERLGELLGYSQNELEGKTISDLTHFDDAIESKTLVEQTLVEGIPFQLEKRLIKKNGEEIWTNIQVSAIKDRDGKPYSAAAIVIDMSERRESGEALRRSEERLRITMESATDFAIITMDIEGEILGWSAGAESILGYREPEVIGKSANIIFTSEDLAAGVPEKEMKQAKREGRAIDERWHRRKDGTRLFMSGVMAPILNGTILTGFVKVARDITERKAAEEALQLSEERHRIALQSAEMGAWDWNLSTGRVIWNAQQNLLLGIEENSDIAFENDRSYFLQFIHPDDRTRIETLLEKAIVEGGIFHAEFRIVRADNKETRWMNGYGRTSGETNTSRIVGVMYDITGRKILEQQKDEFIAVASHELKTPVTSIKAYAEILGEIFSLQGDGKSVELMEKLNTQVDRLTGLIHALLDITRISDGVFRLNLEEMKFEQVIEKCIDELKPISLNHHIVFKKGTKSRMLYADRERLALVVNNLLTNAIKYSPDGGDILIRLEHSPEGAIVTIKDHGIGIQDTLQEKIFERFFRAENSNTQLFQGMGLGLYIAAQIIRYHKGSISVKSKEGKGSEFTFLIPYTRSETV
jgi:two-component system CheB/CheR fusion protein